jgi:hypothetical protein
MPAFEHAELLIALLGLGVLTFTLWQGPNLGAVPEFRWLRASLVALVVGWTASVLEGLAFETFLNFVQHASTAAAAVLLAVWCRRVLLAPDPEGA